LNGCDDDDDVDNKHNNNLFTVASFVKQIDFQIETIQTTSNRTVAERRQTAWEGDEHVENFEYSGKSMRRLTWSDVVANVRDRLHNETSQYYDGCLLNFYPDGDSAMRYHIDPDQGVLWDYETAVVSIGATRRFSFRESSGGDESNKPHVFVLMNGDVTEMFNDCQERFQHTVQKSSVKGESASRVSLVFKKTLGYSKEKTKSTIS
jgi:alkylated DNA repair dioxygenase AlkB